MSSANRGIQIGPPRFKIAVHTLVWLSHSGCLLSSAIIASQVNSHATFLRRVLQSLAAAGLVETKEGRDGGYTLGRSADRITLGDVYLAVKLEVPEICENVDCGEVGELLDLQLDKILLEAEQHTIEYLRQFTIEDVAGRVEFFADSCPNAVLDK